MMLQQSACSQALDIVNRYQNLNVPVLTQDNHSPIITDINTLNILAANNKVQCIRTVLPKFLRPVRPLSVLAFRLPCEQHKHSTNFWKQEYL